MDEPNKKSSLCINIPTPSSPASHSSSSFISSQDFSAFGLFKHPHSPSEGWLESSPKPSRLGSTGSNWDASFLSYLNPNRLGLKGAQSGKNLWAKCFNIRVLVAARQQTELLHASDEDEVSYTFFLERHTWLHNALDSPRMARCLQMLACLGMWFAPLQYAVEPACELGGERAGVAALKSLHFACSIVYVVLAFGQHYVKDGVWKSSHSVKNHYFRHLMLDILALGGLVAEFVHLRENPVAGEPTWIQALLLLHLLKAWRIFACTGRRMCSFAIQVGELFLWLIIAGHFAACVFIKLALVEEKSGHTTWADKLLNRDGPWSCVDLYAAALYFCTYTLTSIGYGDVVPANAQEHMLCVTFMLASQMFTAKIFADLTWITATHQHWKAQSHARLTQTSAALQSMGVDPQLCQRAMAYQHFIEAHQRERNMQSCLRSLSRPLREELKLAVYYDLVVGAPFLREQPIHIVRFIISSLSEEVYLPCDVIIRRGDAGTELFFLRKGRAGVFKTEEMPEWDHAEIHVLGNGSYFGEIALLTGQPRQSWVIARTYCICSVLPKGLIDELLTDHPACIVGLVKSLKHALGLKPSMSQTDLLSLIRGEFTDEALLYEFIFDLQDDQAAGLITWKRWEVLMQRLRISTLDMKLLWVEFDTDRRGVIDFTQFVEVLNQVGPAEDRQGAPVPPQASPLKLEDASITPATFGSGELLETPTGRSTPPMFATNNSTSDASDTEAALGLNDTDVSGGINVRWQEEPGSPTAMRRKMPRRNDRHLLLDIIRRLDTLTQKVNTLSSLQGGPNSTNLDSVSETSSLPDEVASTSSEGKTSWLRIANPSYYARRPSLANILTKTRVKSPG